MNLVADDVTIDYIPANAHLKVCPTCNYCLNCKVDQLERPHFQRRCMKQDGDWVGSYGGQIGYSLGWQFAFKLERRSSGDQQFKVAWLRLSGTTRRQSDARPIGQFGTLQGQTRRSKFGFTLRPQHMEHLGDVKRQLVYNVVEIGGR